MIDLFPPGHDGGHDTAYGIELEARRLGMTDSNIAQALQQLEKRLRAKGYTLAEAYMAFNFIGHAFYLRVSGENPVTRRKSELRVSPNEADSAFDALEKADNFVESLPEVKDDKERAIASRLAELADQAEKSGLDAQAIISARDAYVTGHAAE